MVGHYEDAMDGLFGPKKRKRGRGRQKSDIELGMEGIQEVAAGVQSMANMFGKENKQKRLIEKAKRLKKEEKEHKAAKQARKTIKEIEQKRTSRKKKKRSTPQNTPLKMLGRLVGRRT